MHPLRRKRMDSPRTERFIEFVQSSSQSSHGEKAAQQIRVQESAQKVAWLLNSPNDHQESPGRHPNVSQDRHEICLAFAEFDEGHLKYLNGKISPSEPQSFWLSRCVPTKTKNWRKESIVHDGIW
ncbi:hypothetical protein MPDQ_005007 [Monascus purpureus]|uniref:Uncharacterized protein n=1 Tax=Monascus purpureus TaxID=5098 RepID=A0A507R0N7_MONPU|nr:hypothetical protein MPDQ_005007 [Monascus purpureus]BDD54461.1 hypothetical protein MAP00_000079 [Monascus purpureus]